MKCWKQIKLAALLDKKLRTLTFIDEFCKPEIRGHEEEFFYSGREKCGFDKGE